MLPLELQQQLQTQRRLTLPVKVVPKSAKTAWGEHLPDGFYKVKVAASPERGRANEELLRFLASEFGLAQNQVVLLAGESSARKRVGLFLDRQST